MKPVQFPCTPPVFRVLGTLALAVSVFGMGVRLTDAAAAFGKGSLSSWPSPLPFVQIDHVLSNAHMNICEVQFHSTTASDHAMVAVDLN